MFKRLGLVVICGVIMLGLSVSASHAQRAWQQQQKQGAAARTGAAQPAANLAEFKSLSDCLDTASEIKDQEACMSKGLSVLMVQVQAADEKLAKVSGQKTGITGAATAFAAYVNSECSWRSKADGGVNVNEGLSPEFSELSCKYELWEDYLDDRETDISFAS